MLRPIDFLVEKVFICLPCGNLQTINCFILDFFMSSSKGQYIHILAELLNFVSYRKKQFYGQQLFGVYSLFKRKLCCGPTKYSWSQVWLNKVLQESSQINEIYLYSQLWTAKLIRMVLFTFSKKCT